MNATLILTALLMPAQPAPVVIDSPTIVIERSGNGPATLRLVAPGQQLPPQVATGPVSERHLIPVPPEWYATPEEWLPPTPAQARRVIQPVGYCPCQCPDCICRPPQQVQQVPRQPTGWVQVPQYQQVAPRVLAAPQYQQCLPGMACYPQQQFGQQQCPPGMICFPRR